MRSSDEIKRKILLVDDEETVLWTFQQGLLSYGFAVDVALGGEEALGKVRKEKYDLLVTDLHMDPMDGLSLLQELERRGDRIKAIMLTADGSSATAVEAMHRQAEDFLLKPVSIEKLALQIHRVIGREKESEETFPLLETLCAERGLFNEEKQRYELTTERRSIEELQVFLEKTLVYPGLQPYTKREVILAALEAATNVIEHAHDTGFVVEYSLQQKREGKQRGKYEKDQSVYVSVVDAGLGFDPSTLQTPRTEGYEQVLHEQKRGIYLMRQLMDDVELFSFEGRGTHVHMWKHLYPIAS